MSPVKLGWPEKADWGTVGNISIGAYHDAAIIFVPVERTPDGDSADQWLNPGELRELATVCTILARRLEKRVHHKSIKTGGPVTPAS